MGERPWNRLTTEFVGGDSASPVAVISAHGDIDVTNAAAMTEYALTHAMSCRGLILDLRCLDFFGTEGFSALHRVSVGCARAGTPWAFIPGAAVSRLLRMCDPQGGLPAAPSVDAAVDAVGPDRLRRQASATSGPAHAPAC